MKKLFITAACIVTVLSSFANPATEKNKKEKTTDATMNAVVASTGTKVTVTAISESLAAINIIMKDDQGNEVYEGKMLKGEYAQFAVFNLEQLSEGKYHIVLQNGKDKFEKTIAINTTKQLRIE